MCKTIKTGSLPTTALDPTPRESGNKKINEPVLHSKAHGHTQPFVKFSQRPNRDQMPL